jgi:hypothetical protein
MFLKYELGLRVLKNCLDDNKKEQDNSSCVISGFRRDIQQICGLLGYYGALSASSVPTFRDNVSAPCSRVTKSKKKVFILWLLAPKDGTEMSIQNCHSSCVVREKSTDLMIIHCFKVSLRNHVSITYVFVHDKLCK